MDNIKWILLCLSFDVTLTAAGDEGASDPTAVAGEDKGKQSRGEIITTVIIIIIIETIIPDSSCHPQHIINS